MFGARHRRAPGRSDEVRRAELQRLIEELERAADREDGDCPGSMAAVDEDAAKRLHRRRLSRLYDRFGMGMHERHSSGEVYLTLRAREKRSALTDSQLRAAILTGVLEHGWTTLYFYGGPTAIDKDVSRRAREMLCELTQRGMPLAGMNIDVSGRRMAGVEPWIDGALRTVWTQSLKDLGERKDDLLGAFRDAKTKGFSVLALRMRFRSPVEEDEGRELPDAGNR